MFGVLKLVEQTDIVYIVFISCKTMGDEKSFEDYRKMYIGKELDDCFANLHMTINNEIRTVKQETKETNE